MFQTRTLLWRINRPFVVGLVIGSGHIESEPDKDYDRRKIIQVQKDHDDDQIVPSLGSDKLSDDNFYRPEFYARFDRAKLLQDANKEVKKTIDSFMGVNSPLPGLAICINRNGESVFTNGYGHSEKKNDLVTKPPMQRNTRMPIASISKLFAAHCFALLFPDSRMWYKFNLIGRESAIRDSMRENKANWSEQMEKVPLAWITSHESGIRGYQEWDIKSLPSARDHVIDSKTACKDWEEEMGFRGYPITAQPGQYWYTSYGYNYLGWLLEEQSGKSYASLIREKCLEMGLENTFPVEYRMLKDFKYENFARGYFFDRENMELKDGKIFDYTFYLPSEGICSNVEDLVKFGDLYLRTFQNKDFTAGPLSHDQVRDMWSCFKVIPGSPEDDYVLLHGYLHQHEYPNVLADRKDVREWCGQMEVQCCGWLMKYWKREVEAENGDRKSVYEVWFWHSGAGKVDGYKSVLATCFRCDEEELNLILNRRISGTTFDDSPIPSYARDCSKGEGHVVGGKLNPKPPAKEKKKEKKSCSTKRSKKKPVKHDVPGTSGEPTCEPSTSQLPCQKSETKEACAKTKPTSERFKPDRKLNRSCKEAGEAGRMSADSAKGSVAGGEKDLFPIRGFTVAVLINGFAEDTSMEGFVQEVLDCYDDKLWW